MQKLRLGSVPILTVFALCAGTGRDALATIRDALEPVIAELSVAYQSGDYREALRLSGEILRKDPGVVEALEMRALALKATGQAAEASKIYLDLVKKRWKMTEDKKELAPYYFELGSIRLQEKKMSEAKFYFEQSLKWDFNPTVCRFFLGSIAFQEQELEEARDQLMQVAASDVADLKPTSQFYLAQIAFKQKRPAAGVGHLKQVKALAQGRAEDPNASDESRKTSAKLIEAADKALGPLDKSTFFGNVTLLTGYDSNVLSVPTSQLSGQPDATGSGSIKETLLAGVGYTTSPMNKVQFVPSYRVSYNYNFNKATKQGSFLTNFLSLLTSIDTLEPTSYGLKTDGILTFQDQSSSTESSLLYKPYALSGAIGPFVRHEFQSALSLTGELLWQPVRNYLDPNTNESARRSGNEGVLRVTARRDMGGRYLNPSLSLSGSLIHTTGDEYRARTFGAILGNTFYPTDRLQLNTTLNLSGSTYPERGAGRREDKLWAVDFNAGYKLTQKITLLGDVQYLRNISNLPETYEFDRVSVSGGATYNF